MCARMVGGLLEEDSRGTSRLGKLVFRLAYGEGNLLSVVCQQRRE